MQFSNALARVCFTADDISTAPKVVHQYTVDWEALSLGEEGVIIKIDSDGDGIFEQTITTDSELTHDEFMLQTATTRSTFRNLVFPVVVALLSLGVIARACMRSIREVSVLMIVFY